MKLTKKQKELLKKYNWDLAKPNKGEKEKNNWKRSCT